MKFKENKNNKRWKSSLKHQALGFAFRFLTCHLILVTYFLSAAYGVLLFPLDDLQVIEAEISRQGLTRITVKDDRILNVFGLTGEYVMEADEDQGQVFIRPSGIGSLAPISLTITTEKGHTQDLALAPKNKAPEALVLQAQAVSGNHSSKKLDDTFPSRDEIEVLLQACQEERIPVGYKLIPIKAEPHGTPHQLIREIRGKTLRGFYLKGMTYEVTNRGSIPWILAESDFAEKIEEDAIAILMPTKHLKPGESTYVYVVAAVTE